MIDLDNQTSLVVELSPLQKIASSLSTKDVELIIVNDDMMIELNLKYRGKEQTTDVLSFPIEVPYTVESIHGLPLGSIIISSSHVISKANELKHGTQNELSLLFIHGMLHLLDFDHETDSGEMREQEEMIIRDFNLPTSLIIRTTKE